MVFGFVRDGVDATASCAAPLGPQLELSVVGAEGGAPDVGRRVTRSLADLSSTTPHRYTVLFSKKKETKCEIFIFDFFTKINNKYFNS